MRVIGWLGPLVFGLVSMQAKADELSRCQTQIYQSAPTVLDSVYGAQQDLCFNGFFVRHSANTRTPIFASEYLTKERIDRARTMVREDSFRPEERLSQGARAELKDYKGSGYDRGHMAPNGDMQDPLEQYDSFSLANMVPQDPDHNRNLWRLIEQETRALTRQEGALYVVTGALFQEGTSAKVGEVAIPSHLFKAIYSPAQDKAGVYYSPNDGAQIYEILSPQAFLTRTGVDPFPSLSEASKMQTAHLPQPANYPASQVPQTETTQDSESIWGLLWRLLVAVLTAFSEL